LESFFSTITEAIEDIKAGKMLSNRRHNGSHAGLTAQHLRDQGY
jgi:hypothetical protein